MTKFVKVAIVGYKNTKPMSLPYTLYFNFVWACIEGLSDCLTKCLRR